MKSWKNCAWKGRVACAAFSAFLTLALPVSITSRAAGISNSDVRDTARDTLIDDSVQESRLRLYHSHTNEKIDIVFRRGDAYDPEALAELNHFLRDHRTQEVHRYDPRVFDLLADLTASLGQPDTEIEIVCGYRSPWSNEYLRETTTGVAKNSLHMKAEAIDIRIPPVKTFRLRNAALALQRGGVGYYPQSGFVHVDVGPVRRW
jgi:uncharacterized protein YcbK (DUF882 family)